MEAKSREIDRLAAEVSRLQRELGEREESLALARNEASRLRGKEAESIRSGEVVRSQEKELETLHTKLQKSESRFNEEKLKIESRVTFAEQSLEAYKKEMEGYLREKSAVEAELKQNREELAQLKKANEVGCGLRGGAVESDARAQNRQRNHSFLRGIHQQTPDVGGHQGRIAHRARAGGRRPPSRAGEGNGGKGSCRANSLRGDDSPAVAAGVGDRGEQPAAAGAGRAASESGEHADVDSGGRSEDRTLEGRAGEQLPAEADFEAVHAAVDGGGRGAAGAHDEGAEGEAGAGAGFDASRGCKKRREHAERG